MPKPKITPALSQLADEYGDLAEKIAPHKANIKRLEEVGKALRAHVADLDPEESAEVAGERHSVTIGPRGYESKIISLEKVFSKLGKSKFLAACSLTLKALETALTPADVLTLTERKRTGYRPLEPRPFNK
jgi:hypothetical protein